MEKGENGVDCTRSSEQEGKFYQFYLNLVFTHIGKFQSYPSDGGILFLGVFLARDRIFQLYLVWNIKCNDL